MLLSGVCAIALLAALCLPGPLGASDALADGAPTAYVTTGRLNVRTGPGVGYSVITRIDQWQTVTLLARNAATTWVSIRLPNGVEGWVNAHYLQASVPIDSLPVTGATPAPAVTGTVSVAQLELRAGPGTQYGVRATLGQGQTFKLLGRNADTSWVQVNVANLGDGWVVAHLTVRASGAEGGLSVQPFQASVDVSTLPVVAAPSVPRPTVSLANSRVSDGSPVFIGVAGFPADRPIAAVLTSVSVPVGTVVATGQTDGYGNAQLFFRMPDRWPSGAAIVEAGLSLAVGTTDGAVLVWSGVWCS
jgi:uncharacterized protein YraI